MGRGGAVLAGLRDRRKRAGWSLAKAAAFAGVCEPTARVFEVDPDEVKDDAKRASLHRVYAQFPGVAAATASKVP